MIVLSGEAGVGKDSIADLLCVHHGFQKFSLSTKMKRFAKDVFGFTEEQLTGPSHMRNKPDPRWARPCPRCKGTGSDCSVFPIEGCHNCEGDGRINDNSPRRVLQLLGTEWGRDLIHPDIWTLSNREELDDLMCRNATRVVVTDARFTNDRNNLHEWYSAHRVHVCSTVQNALANSEWRSHASENDGPTSEDIDFTFFNDEVWPFPSLEKLVSTMVEELL